MAAAAANNAPTAFSNTPIYSVVVDGADVTPSLAGRLVSMTITDNRGGEADQLDITLDDTDGRLDMPPRGAELQVAIGFAEFGLVDKGIFTIDEVEHSGAPDQITIRGRSADLRGPLTEKRERSWHDTTVGTIVRTIAAEHKLKAAVHSGLGAEPIAHMDQTNESDSAFLTRLAGQFDAVSTVKSGKLLFVPKGKGETASGKPLPEIHITRQSGDSHRFSMADRDTYTGVKAYYQDTKGAKKGEVIANKKGKTADDQGKNEKGVTQSASNFKVLRHTYASKANATRAANAEWQRLQRGVATLSLTLAFGRADITPESPVAVSGFKPEIDGTGWIVTKATHSLSDSGFTTAVEMEVKAEGVPDVEEAEE